MTNPRDDLMALAGPIFPAKSARLELIDLLKEQMFADYQKPDRPSITKSILDRVVADLEHAVLLLDELQKVQDKLFSKEQQERLATSRPAPQQTTSRIGAWLAAALDDPSVCAEMKADIEAWMNAGEPPYLPAPVDREAVAWAICQSGKFETGEGTCALLCMDQLGSPRKKGCCHSARVHGKLADAILSLLRPAEDEIEQMASRPLYTHPPKSPEMIELLKLAYDNMFDGEAREQVRRKLFE